MISNLTINSFLERNILLSKDLINDINEEEVNEILSIINEKVPNSKSLLVLNKDLLFLLKSSENIVETNWFEFEKARVMLELGKDDKIYNTFLNILNYNISPDKKEIMNSLLGDTEKNIETNNVGIEITDNKESLIVVRSYVDKYIKKREIQDFVSYYNQRFEFFRRLLKGRSELQSAISINRLKNKQDREDVAIIGMVSNKSISKNGNLIVTLEDVTGEIKIVFNKNRENLYDEASEIVCDEIIGITGVFSGSIIFANNLFFPDIPKSHELKKSPDETYAAFISDIHVGSKKFLRKEFMRFIDWINGNIGSKEQRNTALKVKYLFIVGDNVDGVGVYPGQEEHLEIKDYYEQYNQLSEILKQIRKDVKMVMCPGQHDASRLAEPQSIIMEKYAKSLYEIDNLTLVTNPAVINIHSSETFEGFNVLIYHGASFHYYISVIDKLRNNKANENPSLVLKYLLKRRHLAPTHESFAFIPDPEQDPRVINAYVDNSISKIPDFFIAGDMHHVDVNSYNNITLINCSCWQSRTDFEIKVGNMPDPCKVPIVNLMTREIKIMKFGEEDGRE